MTIFRRGQVVRLNRDVSVADLMSNRVYGTIPFFQKGLEGIVLETVAVTRNLDCWISVNFGISPDERMPWRWYFRSSWLEKYEPRVQVFPYDFDEMVVVTRNLYALDLDHFRPPGYQEFRGDCILERGCRLFFNDRPNKVDTQASFCAFLGDEPVFFNLRKDWVVGPREEGFYDLTSQIHWLADFIEDREYFNRYYLEKYGEGERRDDMDDFMAVPENPFPDEVYPSPGEIRWEAVRKELPDIGDVFSAVMSTGEMRIFQVTDVYGEDGGLPAELLEPRKFDVARPFPQIRAKALDGNKKTYKFFPSDWTPERIVFLEGQGREEALNPYLKQQRQDEEEGYRHGKAGNEFPQRGPYGEAKTPAYDRGFQRGRSEYLSELDLSALTDTELISVATQGEEVLVHILYGIYTPEGVSWSLAVSEDGRHFFRGTQNRQWVELSKVWKEVNPTFWALLFSDIEEEY